jgi:hypothetical protein
MFGARFALETAAFFFQGTIPQMRLATFIRSNIESIAAEWELFAESLLPEAEFSKSVLRDGIADILAEITADMERGQSDAQQKDKSEGQPRRDPQVDNGAERHALARSSCWGVLQGGYWS